MVVSTISFAQNTEWGVSLNSGLFSFDGKSSESSSFIIYSDQFNTGYTNNPYGKNEGISYGISGFGKRISKQNFIYGIDLGYERLKSVTKIDRISGTISDMAITSIYEYNATGKTFLKYSNINTFPFVGYRLNLGKLNADIIGGLDVGFILHSTEKGVAKGSNGVTYKTSLDRKTINTDLRPRMRVMTEYNNFGAYIGYSLGLSNYKSEYIGGNNEAYSRIIRFGLTYKLN